MEVSVSLSIPQGDALLHCADGNFATVKLRGPRPPPVSPYCDIVARAPSEDGCWWGLDRDGERLLKFKELTVRETPWLRKLPTSHRCHHCGAPTVMSKARKAEYGRPAKPSRQVCAEVCWMRRNVA